MSQTRALPDRYGRWRDPFEEQFSSMLRPGIRILDIGSGCNPILSPAERPTGSVYVGLDVSEQELARAPQDSYTETRISGIERYLSVLYRSFDLVVSWQLLEHVKPLEVAIHNVHRYLRPGGRFVAMLSGRFSACNLINLVVPQ